MANTAMISDRGLDSSSPSAALCLSQQAPVLLKKYRYPIHAFPLSLAADSENADQWATCEQLLLVCLRTGDDKTAHLCLDRLTERFGPSNERIMALRGLYQEATAKDMASLGKVLSEYEKLLSENPVNVVSWEFATSKQGLHTEGIITACSETPSRHSALNV